MKVKYSRPNIVGSEMIESAIPFLVGVALAGYAAKKVADVATSAAQVMAPSVVQSMVKPRPKAKLKSFADKKIF